MRGLQSLGLALLHPHAVYGFLGGSVRCSSVLSSQQVRGPAAACHLSRPCVARRAETSEGVGDVPAPSASAKINDNEILYEECTRYSDKTAVAQEVILEITSMEHFKEVVSRAGGADELAPDGYEDAQGRWRHPHKLMVVEVYAGWCRVCKGLQPKILKLMKQHPEVLCCKINKTANEELAAYLGVRGLPMIIFYKKGKRIDHHTTANINTIEEAIRDNS